MTLSRERAETIAIAGLQYLAGDSEQLGRFLQISGYQPADLRNNAASPEFLAGILEFFLGNEPTLLAFTAQHDINPADIAPARDRLGAPGTDNPLN